MKIEFILSFKVNVVSTSYPNDLYCLSALQLLFKKSFKITVYL